MDRSEGSLVSVPVLIAANAFFVAAEYAVVAMRPGEVAGLAAGGWGRTAGAIRRLQGSPAGAIGTIQVCITMTNLMLGWLGEPAMGAVLDRLLGPVARVHPGFFGAVSTVLSFVVVTLLTVVLSELLPKALTLKYASVAAKLTAVPVVWIMGVMRPLVWVMTKVADGVTRPLGLGTVEEMEGRRATVEELRVMTGEVGELSARERSLVLNSLAMRGRTAREIMTPRTRVAYLDLKWSMGENLRVMGERVHSRMPLCDGGMDRVVGVVPVKEFLLACQEEGAASEVMLLLARKPVFVPETVRVDRLLETVQAEGVPFVFVVDEHGGVEGIVTLQDVVDEVIGEGGQG